MENKSLLEQVRADLGPELEALEKAWYEKGKKDASGGGVAGGSKLATAEKLAARARALMVADPALTSAAAVRAAYEEAGESLE